MSFGKMSGTVEIFQTFFYDTMTTHEQTILVSRVFLGKTLALSGHMTLRKLIAQGGVAKYQITCFHRKR
jgi:hypothetical protein